MNEKGLQVLYEDNHIIVVLKPAGILSQEDVTKDMDMLTIIKQYLKDKYQKSGNVYLGLVHRLDRMTSGVMVFAKTSKAASRLFDSINKNLFHKKYYAILANNYLAKEGHLVDYLSKDESTGITYIDSTGKEADLNYQIIEEKNNLALADITLNTGRHHQIRVQLSSRNHSIYGDQKYGNRGRGKQIALWAYELSFSHPITKEQMNFKSIPQMNGTWKILEDIQL